MCFECLSKGGAWMVKRAVAEARGRGNIRVPARRAALRNGYIRIWSTAEKGETK